MRVFILNGHPDKGSLCDALSHAYGQAAREAGQDVQLTNIRELVFDPVLRGGFTRHNLSNWIFKSSEIGFAGANTL